MQYLRNPYPDVSKGYRTLAPKQATLLQKLALLHPPKIPEFRALKHFNHMSGFYQGANSRIKYTK